MGSGCEYNVLPTPECYWETDPIPTDNFSVNPPAGNGPQYTTLMAKVRLIPVCGQTGSVYVEIEAWMQDDYAATSAIVDCGHITMACDPLSGNETSFSSQDTPAVDIWRVGLWTAGGHAWDIAVYATTTVTHPSAGSATISVEATVEGHWWHPILGVPVKTVTATIPLSATGSLAIERTPCPTCQ